MANPRPDSKWICFEEVQPAKTRATKVYDVYPKADKVPGDTEVACLGRVSWYGAWRCYSFWPAGGTLFEARCLADIALFLNWLMNERAK